MARQYPKFLYQHVTNAKSNGHFIMHLQAPAVLMQVVEDGPELRIRLMEQYQEAEEKELRAVLDRALRWYLMTHRQTPETQPVDLLPTGKPLRDAYEEMLSTRGMASVLGIARSTLSNIRTGIRQGKYPSDEIMRRDLLAAGWMCMQQELWAKFPLT